MEGYKADYDEKTSTFRIIGQQFDPKGKILAKTVEMV